MQWRVSGITKTVWSDDEKQTSISDDKTITDIEYEGRLGDEYQPSTITRRFRTRIKTRGELDYYSIDCIRRHACLTKEVPARPDLGL